MTDQELQTKKQAFNTLLKEQYKTRSVKYWTAAQAKKLAKQSRLLVLVDKKFIEFRFKNYKDERTIEKIANLKKRLAILEKSLA